MKKLYYSCPSSAAYMSKNFGIRFELQTEEYLTGIKLVYPISYNFFEWPRTELITEDFDIRYYVVKDSLSIFEPQEGDVCSWPENTYLKYFIWNVNAEYIAPKRKIKIIERDNKPFIMPEVEYC